MEAHGIVSVIVETTPRHRVQARKLVESWRLRCADAVDVAGWVSAWSHFPDSEPHEKPQFQTFCTDAQPSWCVAERAEGRCVRAEEMP